MSELEPEFYDTAREDDIVNRARVLCWIAEVHQESRKRVAGNQTTNEQFDLFERMLDDMAAGNFQTTHE